MVDRVLGEVEAHCLARGGRPGPGVNNFVPNDPVAAFTTAQTIIRERVIDEYVAVAPEGHIYGWFFEQLGAPVRSLHVDYPPTRCRSEGDLSALRDRRVLVIEDDVIGGATLRLVVAHREAILPRSLALFLGHTRGVQHLENVPARFEGTWVAEGGDGDDFLEFFGGR